MKVDYDTDVLIVGYGAAGANAAIAAHDAGARVLIMEKLDYPGGNSGVCAGSMLIPESVEEAVRYYRGLSFGTVDEKMIRVFAEAMVGIPRLLTELGRGGMSTVYKALDPKNGNRVVAIGTWLVGCHRGRRSGARVPGVALVPGLAVRRAAPLCVAEACAPRG